MYTIYIKQSSIRIISLSELSGNDPSTVQTVSEVGSLLLLIQDILNSEIPINQEVSTKSPKNMLKSIKDSLVYIKAGGGLVKNEKKQYLMIHRLGFWDLPKGKLESKEEIEACAVREVAEETGIQILTVKKELPSTYHIYQLDGSLILKRTYWFLMKAKEDQCLVPQKEEGIDEVKWVSVADLWMIKTNIYPLIEEVLSTIPDYIN